MKVQKRSHSELPSIVKMSVLESK